ncbi:MAG: pyruvate, phosphate dikinase [Bacteroidetes bacterium]|nr:pyruvate, phosphate dikinase [Bacteroidota bacterium]
MSASEKKHVYFFGNGESDGRADMKNLLGGKGANLCEMTNLKLPVPPGIIISTEVCVHFYKNNWTYPFGLENQVHEAFSKVEKLMGKRFGDLKNPLLVSVRSGARTSMPGMMDTILNLGLNDETVKGLIANTGNERFAYDSYRRFIAMYSDVVLGVGKNGESNFFDEILDKKKEDKGIENDTDLDAKDLKEIVKDFKAIVKKRTGKPFPEDPKDQLWGAISAVFRSWMNPRAIEYRKIYHIPEEWGTAVNVMAMVYGNMGEDCGTGVAFTRSPATGENKLYGEYLVNAQGEDVVAGIRTPKHISEMEVESPDMYKQLADTAQILEHHYKDMQDIEFTIEKGKFFMLQCRSGKRTGLAALRIAVDLVDQGYITKEEALMRIEPTQMNQLLRPTFDPKEVKEATKAGRLLGKGLPAGPGAASGRIVFRSEDVEHWTDKGDPVILVRIETSPEDIKGMRLAEGILTARGGMTSHAALVARQMGKVCIVGCDPVTIDYHTFTMTIGDKTYEQGHYISIDGSTGEVLEGQLKTRPSDVIQKVLMGKDMPDSVDVKYYEKIMAWTDEVRAMKIFANADQPDQCQQAIAFGAQGIGLCRTEHMFFGEERITLVREMLLSSTEKERRKYLAGLLELQRSDFEGILEVMNGYPVIIRTIDPPLHEFLPKEKAKIQEVANAMKVAPAKLKRKIDELHEENPMLGMRGCRLGIIFPEIIEMQARAILEAALNLKAKGKPVHPEIMIPLVSNVNELNNQKAIVDRIARELFSERGMEVAYKVGTMIEIPRAALTADEIAKSAEFFSFGTNDLTQTTLGLSRDDAGKFLPYYIEKNIFEYDPFVTIDQTGVGKLMEIAVAGGRKSRPDIEIGICGEHGGEPMSIVFANHIGLNYVSCSPFRIPIARLAAAQAAIMERKSKK